MYYARWFQIDGGKFVHGLAALAGRAGARIFEETPVVSIDPFIDIIGRHFKQPKEGLGFDNSPVAHMWRSISFPDHPL